MKLFAIILTAALLLSCSQPVETAETVLAEIEEAVIEPTPPPDPQPQPITAPWGSTVIGEKAYYVQNGAATVLDLRTGAQTVVSSSVREYERINEREDVDNTDTGRLAPWGYNTKFFEVSGALWIFDWNYNSVRAQVVTQTGIKDIGYIKEIDLISFSENVPGKKIAMSYTQAGRFYRIKLYQLTDPNAWLPFAPKPIPDYVLRYSEILLRPEMPRPVSLGSEVTVYTAEKWEGAFTFEYLSDGRILGAGKLFRLTEHGLEAE